MSANEAVVITGIGIVSCFGMGWKNFWEGAIGGKSGVAPISGFDTTDYAVKFAAEVPDFDPCQYVTKKEARHLDRTVQFSLAAAQMAVDDAALEINDSNRERAGVIIGSGIGGMHTFEEQASVILSQGPRKVSPFFIPMMIANMPSGQISIRFGMRGPNFGTVSACASGTHAIGLAADYIRAGKADIMLAGGAEASVTPLCVAGFCSMRALSTRNDDFAHASRPFDAQRDGFVVGEGAGVLVLESLSSALARGAHIYAVVAGSASTADAYHITAPDPSGSGAKTAMRLALHDAGMVPEDIDYVNAHGTSTPVGDPAECKAIKEVFGDHTQRLAVSSTKSMTGHLLGAAGALETAVCTLAVHEGVIPPTINYEYPDPDCDLDVVPNVARQTQVRAAINNSFGFGGQNAVVVIRAYSEGTRKTDTLA